MSFLGIDIGTSGLRVLLMDGGGRPLGVAEQSYATSHPHPGWSEQDPADWITALEAAMLRLRDEHPVFSQIRGIGVAGHMHGAVLLDARDKLLRPCIMWNDTRSHAEASTLDAQPEFQRLSGNIVFSGFTAPKLEWVRTHEPDVFNRIAKTLLPAAYLNLYLTGAHVSDLSDASGTAWLDVAARDWSAPLLAAGHMQRAQMPRLVEGSEQAGLLRSDLAARWGFDGQVSVAGGAGDNAAAACGLGVLEEGTGFVSLGTSGVLLMARNGCHPAPQTALHTFCHAVPDRWYQMGVMLAATDCLNWLSTITGQPPQDLTDGLGGDITPPGAVRFYPYLSGERTPHNDSAIRGGFSGLGIATTRTDLTHAVLEGVCFGLRDAMEALKSTGGTFKHLYAIGGGSASRYWLSLLATILNTPLHIPEGREFGAALGAARLGRAAASDEAVDEVMQPAPVAEIITPVAALTDAFDAGYAQFRAGYGLLGALQNGGGA